MATAFRTAMSGRPGPVHLTLPIDLQEAPISEEDLPPFLPQEYRNMGRSQGDPKLIEQAANLLANAQKAGDYRGQSGALLRRAGAAGGAGGGHGRAHLHRGAGARDSSTTCIRCASATLTAR